MFHYPNKKVDPKMLPTMPDVPSFDEDSISKLPALLLLRKLGYTYLKPDEALAARGGRYSNVLLESILIEQLRKDEAIAEADTLLLTIPNQLGVAYNAHVMEAILTTIAPALGWR